MKINKVAVLATMATALVLPVHGASYIYEGFNYALSNGTAMGGVATTATGLTGNYTSTSTGTAPVAAAVYTSTGLSFGGNFYAVTGGALSMSLTAGAAATQSIQLNAAFSTGTQTGTIYSSNLFTVTSLGSSGAGATGSTASTSQMRVTSAANASTNAHFSELFEGGATNGASAVAYATTRTDGTTVLTLNTTYLSISKFTNAATVGQSGVADMWVLDLAGYNNWLTLGSGLEANLTTYATTHLTQTTTTTAANSAFSNTQFLSLAVSNASTTLTESFTVDEARYGSSLLDVVNVTAVPEPSVYGMAIALGVCGLAIIRRRKAVG